MINKILRAEGLVIFLLAAFVYSKINGNWLLFALLLLAPDISMAGYLRKAEIGAIIYNLVHNYVLAALIIFSGFLVQNELLQGLGLILTAHIGLDRTLGFGLKEPAGFKNTHLGKIGK